MGRRKDDVLVRVSIAVKRFHDHDCWRPVSTNIPLIRVGTRGLEN